jgi:hypothetical protein
MTASPLPPPPAVSLEIQAAIQAARDIDHLRLLEIGFYISAGLSVLRFLWFLLILVFFSIGGFAAAFAAAHGKNTNPDAAPPTAVFIVVAIVFGCILVLMLVFGVLEFYAAVCLKNRKHPVAIQIVAAVYCLSIPWGTALGVATFMVLNRPSVKALFT